MALRTVLAALRAHIRTWPCGPSMLPCGHTYVNWTAILRCSIPSCPACGHTCAHGPADRHSCPAGTHTYMALRTANATLRALKYQMHRFSSADMEHLETHSILGCPADRQCCPAGTHMSTGQQFLDARSLLALPAGTHAHMALRTAIAALRALTRTWPCGPSMLPCGHSSTNYTDSLLRTWNTWRLILY